PSMTHRGIGVLALALGLLASGVGGDAVRAQAPDRPAAAVGLDRPVPLPTPVDPNLRPAYFGPAARSVPTLARGAAPDVGLERPQPVPSPLLTNSAVSNTMFQWRRPGDDPVPTAPNAGLVSIPVSPANAPPAFSGPAQTPPVVSTQPLRSI